MTNYARSAYGSNNPNAGKPANGDRYAWGGYAYPGGVPSSLLGYTTGASRDGQAIKVLVRKEIVPLWDLLWRIAVQNGYNVIVSNGGQYPGPTGAWGPWGYENRAVSGTNTPSGHSMALSVDINAPYNPYSYTFQCDMPPGMVSAFEACGLYWGGRYEGQKYDPMHFGYCWGPSSVAGHIAKAQSILGSNPTPDPGDDVTDDDIKKIVNQTAAEVMKRLQSDKVVTMESYNDKGQAQNEPVSVTRALQSAQVMSTRTYQKVK